MNDEAYHATAVADFPVAVEFTVRLAPSVVILFCMRAMAVFDLVMLSVSLLFTYISRQTACVTQR